jgi:hypothetical protein
MTAASQAIVDAVVDLIDTPALSVSGPACTAPGATPDASSAAVSFVATQLTAGRATAKPEASLSSPRHLTQVTDVVARGCCLHGP